MTAAAKPAAVVISASEKRVLDALLDDGADNAAIARRVQLSTETVKTHISRLLGKTGCRTRTELVVLIMRDRVQLLVDPRAGGPRPRAVDGG